MKALIFLMAACSLSAAAAADVPAALKPTQAIAHVMKIEDLVEGSVAYRVDFCEQDDCDMFQADTAHVSELADYSQLFLSTHSEYLNATPKQLDPPAVAAALSKGAKRYSCPADKNQTRCVMHALFKAGHLKRYTRTWKDGEVFQKVGEGGQ